MKLIHAVSDLREQVSKWHRDGLTVGFVPTMGNLHDGHLALVDEAFRHADRVLVSIFVNPMQFGEGEDFENYPRTLEEDWKALEAHDATLLFAPGVDEMYPPDPDGKPRFLFYPTITTHIPFRPTPPYQPDWSRVTSDRPYSDEATEKAMADEIDWHGLFQGYINTINYTFRWLAGYQALPQPREQAGGEGPEEEEARSETIGLAFESVIAAEEEMHAKVWEAEAEAVAETETEAEPET